MPYRGGALVNARGDLIGINTAIVSRSGGNQGIGFSGPSNLARQTMDQILKHGRVVHGWLGVSIQPVNAVAPGSPAAKSGNGWGTRMICG